MFPLNYRGLFRTSESRQTVYEPVPQPLAPVSCVLWGQRMVVDFYKIRILVFIIKKILVLISWAIFKHDYWFRARMSSKDPITMMRNSSQGRLQFRSLPLLVCFAAWPCAQAFLFCLSFLHTLYSVHNSPCAAGVWKWFFFPQWDFFLRFIFYTHVCLSVCMCTACMQIPAEAKRGLDIHTFRQGWIEVTWE